MHVIILPLYISYLGHFVVIDILQSQIALPWDFPACYERDYELSLIQQVGTEITFHNTGHVFKGVLANSAWCLFAWEIYTQFNAQNGYNSNLTIVL